MKKQLSFLFIFILICRIFSFYDGCGQASTEKAINEWIKDKKVISITQSSSVRSLGMGGGIETVITIFAEEK